MSDRTIVGQADPSGKLVKKEKDGRDFPLASDDEIGSGIFWRLPRAARYPSHPAGIADLFRRKERLMSKVGMSGLDPRAPDRCRFSFG